VLRAAGMVAHDRWARHLAEPCSRFAILPGKRLAAFAATIAHESAGGTVLLENLNYSVGGLQATWPARFPPDVAAKLGRSTSQPADQEGIANRAYGGRMGNTLPGDGWRYRGRGLIQLTGRDAYRQAGAALGVDYEASPDLAAQEPHAALIAAWTWAEWKGCNALADTGNIEGWRRAINGGLNGLADVRKRYEAALVA
jgi:putative chitinase